MIKLVKNILAPLFFYEPASFEFDGSIDEGIKLLAANVKRPWFFTTEELLLGKVTPERISFWHYRPFKQQLITAVFCGKFTEENERTLLLGEFRLNKFQKIFYSCLFALFVIITGILALTGLPIIISLVPLSIMIAILYGCYQASKGDIKYMEAKLTEILQGKRI